VNIINQHFVGLEVKIEYLMTLLIYLLKVDGLLHSLFIRWHYD